MSETTRIANLLTRAFEGGAWHGPSIEELLTDVTVDAAARRPIPGAHTIWEIVLHVTAWQRAVLRRLLGESVRELPEELDWPPVPDTSEAAWRRAVAHLEETYKELRNVIRSLPPERLDQSLVGAGREWTVYLTLHGIIQHNLYHAGQIAILKKGAARSSGG